MSSIHVATTGVPEAFFAKFEDFGTIGPSSPKIGYFCNCRAFLQMHDAKGHEIKNLYQKHADTMLNKGIRVIFIEKSKNPLKGPLPSSIFMKFCIKLLNVDTNTTLKCLIHQTLINLLILWFKICIKPLILAKFDQKAGFLAKNCEAHLRHHLCQNI